MAILRHGTEHWWLALSQSEFAADN